MKKYFAIAVLSLGVSVFTNINAQVNNVGTNPGTSNTPPANAGSSRLDKPPLDGAYKRADEPNKPIVNYQYLREADVIWRKRVWRLIDVREKINLPFALPQHTLIELLLDGINRKEIKPYSAENDSFTYGLTEENLKLATGTTTDTVQVPMPDGTFQAKVVPRPFDPKSVKRYRIKEDWVFDKQTSTMIVRILGICPVKDDVDDQGNIRGEKPMFWIYYPECRQFLAKLSSYNEQNDAVHLSWEDLFEQRKFSSYVIKEDNVYDRRIKDYASGIDALLESDKIKNVIFNWEHDVWSF